MLDWLIIIPGPLFLLLYFMVATSAIIFAYILNKDGTENLPLPDVTQYDYMPIAVIKGEWKQVLRTAIFSLYQKKIIGIVEKSGLFGTKIEIKRLKSNHVPANPIEEIFYECLEKPMNSKKIYKSNELRDKIIKAIDPIKRELVQDRILKREEDIKKSWVVFYVTLIPVFVLGFTKLVLGITRGKPIVFLFIFIIIFVVVLSFVVYPREKKTKLGIKYLKEMEKYFKWVKDALSKNKNPEGIDPAFGVALFGITIIGATSSYGAYRHAFQKAGDSYTTGGCGGGAGCGGGGGCGGGCGGCGGCGG